MAETRSAKPGPNSFQALLAFGFLLSGMMSFLVSGISTARALGFAHVASDPGGFLGLWAGNWASSWVVAFPVVLVVAPMVRKIVNRWFAG